MVHAPVILTVVKCLTYVRHPTPTGSFSNWTTVGCADHGPSTLLIADDTVIACVPFSVLH